MDAIGYIKHGIKTLIGKEDPAWDDFAFQKSIRPETWENRSVMLRQAENELAHANSYESDEAYATSIDPVVTQGHKLKKQIELAFKDKHADAPERILIHVPDATHSPAGYSLFTSLQEAFIFLGVTAELLQWHEPITPKINSFRPTAILTSDHPSYLERIDWDSLNRYRKTNSACIVGLTAPFGDQGMSPLRERLVWAREHGIDFFYSFHHLEFLRSNSAYTAYLETGYPLFSVPFGANIARYFPPANIEQSLAYAYLASKKSNAADFLRPVMSKYAGFIDGPGWDRIIDFKFNRDRDRYVYAHAKIGLNLHLQLQRDWPCEVNERTYQLGACGIPQVTDHAAIFDTLFDSESLFIANTPAEYLAHVQVILQNPEWGTKRALRFQKEVFNNHTTFHRAESFLLDLQETRK